MTTTVLDVMEAVVIRPGDVLVLRVAAAITPAQVKNYRDTLVARLGDRVADVLVVNADQLAVIREATP